MIAYRTMYDSVQSPSSPPSPPEFKSNYQRLVSNNEGDLRASVQRLEEQLDEARLRVRVMELESNLSRQIEIEERLRMEVQARSSGMQAAAQPAMRQETDPLSWLASASMMHSAMQRYSPSNDSSDDRASKKQRRK